MTCLAITALGAPPARADVTYKTEFKGVEGDLQSTLNAVSQLVALQKRKPPTVAALYRRGLNDLARLKAVLESQGYYDAGVELTIDQKQDPVAARVDIQLGPRYKLAHIRIVTPAGDLNALDPKLDLGVKPGDAALAQAVIDAEAKLLTYHLDHGYPLAKVSERRTVIDTGTKTMDVTYDLDPGLKANFGLTAVNGLKRLDPNYVRRRVAWKPGDPYDQRVVDQTNQKLVATGLFGAIKVTPDTKIAPDGLVPMKIDVGERALRTLSAGAAYDTSEGIEGTLGWEYRDLFGGAEDLKASTVVGQSDNGAKLTFTRPDVLATDQDFVANLGFDNALQDAFRTISQTGSIGLNRRFDSQLTGGIALQAEHARINEITDTRVYTLVGIPVTVARDTSDDALNPSRGERLSLTVTPYLRALGSNLTYIQALGTATHYHAFDKDKKFILAWEGQLGSSFGTSLASIPKDHRFFAGGGGSVRGFGFQRGGPVDSGNNPIGGRSLVETSVELRMRVSQSIGIVPFYDAGTDYASPLPDLTAKIYQGVGIGVRYFSAIGPVRLDLATPVNPHASGDSPIQVYVSIGQAF